MPEEFHIEPVHAEENEYRSCWSEKLQNNLCIILAPVVRMVDNAIHWINLYPLDSAIGLPNTYRWIVICLVDHEGTQIAWTVSILESPIQFAVTSLQ